MVLGFEISTYASKFQSKDLEIYVDRFSGDRFSKKKKIGSRGKTPPSKNRLDEPLEKAGLVTT